MTMCRTHRMDELISIHHILSEQLAIHHLYDMWSRSTSAPFIFKIGRMVEAEHIREYCVSKIRQRFFAQFSSFLAFAVFLQISHFFEDQQITSLFQCIYYVTYGKSAH